MGGELLTGQRFSEVARDQERLPLSIAQYLFAPTNELPNQNPWSIRYYYGGDIPADVDPKAAADKSGFAATLFQQGENGEKVLAIRGTEPRNDYFVDLAVDFGGIGVLGMALPQVVSMVNLIQRLKAPARGRNGVRGEMERNGVRLGILHKDAG